MNRFFSAGLLLMGCSGLAIADPSTRDHFSDFQTIETPVEQAQWVPEPTPGLFAGLAGTGLLLLMRRRF